MKLYFVVQSCVGFQGSLRSTHRSLVCLHKANIELNVSWLSQLDPFRLLSLGAKRHPPHRQRYHLNQCLASFLSAPFHFSFPGIYSPACLVRKKNLSQCSPVCSESSSSVCWELTHRAKHSSRRLFSLRLFPPSPPSPALCEAQWSVPKCASEGFLPHLTPARIHTQKIGMKIETRIN